MRYAALGLLFYACGQAPYFDEKTCPFKVDASQVQGKTMRCGVLHTPEVHAHPDKLIEIPVLIFLGKKTARLPIVNVNGGPGQSWDDLGLNTYTASETTQFREDLIFIEQRGSGLSKPRLDCPAPTSDSETDAQYFQACASDLADKKVNVAAYNTLELAGDVDTLVKVLDYKRVLMSGVSYGTAWELEVMRQYPTILGGAVLDSVLSPSTPPWMNSASLANDSFTALFQTCANDAGCASAFGDVEGTMLSDLHTLTSLDDAGTSLPVSDGTRNTDGSLKTVDTLSADAFFGTCFDLLASDAEDLPLYIQDVDKAISAGVFIVPPSVDENQDLEKQATQSIALGQYYAIMCSYDQQVTLADTANAAAHARPAFAPYLDDSENLVVCQNFTFQKFGASEFAPVTSAVPALLLSGDIDPLTPPPWPQEVAAALPIATLVQVPDTGHDVEVTDNQGELDCVGSIIGNFYNTPGKVDGSCATTVASQFTLSDETVTRDIDYRGFIRAHSHAPNDPRRHVKRYSRASTLRALARLRRLY